MTQIGEHVLQQRAHGREQVRQHRGQFAMGLGVDVVDVRTEDDITVVADVDVRGQPLELLRELVLRVTVRRVAPSPLGRAARLPHQTEQRGMNQIQYLAVGSGVPVLFCFGDLFQDPDRLAQPGSELVVYQRVRLPHPVDGGHLDAGSSVPQRGVMREFGKHVTNLGFGEALGDRFLRPPGDDVGVVHLVEPPGLRPNMGTALHHLKFPQRSGRRERYGTGSMKGQRESRRASQFSGSSQSVCGGWKATSAD